MLQTSQKLILEILFSLKYFFLATSPLKFYSVTLPYFSYSSSSFFLFFILSHMFCHFPPSMEQYPPWLCTVILPYSLKPWYKLTSVLWVLLFISTAYQVILLQIIVFSVKQNQLPARSLSHTLHRNAMYIYTL